MKDNFPTVEEMNKMNNSTQYLVGLTTKKQNKLRIDLKDFNHFYRYHHNNHSLKYVILSEVMSIMGTTDAIRRYCCVTSQFLMLRVDREENRIYEPIAGCLAAGYKNISLYTPDMTDGHIRYKKQI